VGDYSLVGGGSHSFLLSGSTFSTFDFPGSFSTIALGINNSGQVVGYYNLIGGASHNFLLSGGTFSSFDFPGGFGTFAKGINDSGQVVGYYILNPGSGATHGFLLSGGTFSTLDFPGASSTTVTGINNSGQVVGDYQTVVGPHHGFLATPTELGAPVPEAGTLYSVVGTLGLIGMWSWRRRRHSSSQ